MLLPPKINCCENSYLQYNCNKCNYKCLKCEKVFIYKKMKLSPCCLDNYRKKSINECICTNCFTVFDNKYITYKSRWERVLLEK